jgi:hypothetical protein
MCDCIPLLVPAHDGELSSSVSSSHHSSSLLVKACERRAWNFALSVEGFGLICKIPSAGQLFLEHLIFPMHAGHDELDCVPASRLCF